MFRANYSSTLTPAMMRKLIAEEGAILLDVRTLCEYAGYHLKKSVNIPHNEIERFRNSIKTWGKPVITFSGNGRRSEIAAQKLRSFGIKVYDAKSIYVVEKGLAAEA